MSLSLASTKVKFVLEQKKVYDFNIEPCNSIFLQIPVLRKQGPLFIRMIKDVMNKNMLPLEANEDVVMYLSKFNNKPCSKDYQYKHHLNEDIQIVPTDYQSFSVQNIYVGLFSMSGLSIRIGYGLYKDPFGCNSALMRKKTANLDSKEAQKEKEE